MAKEAQPGGRRGSDTPPQLILPVLALLSLLGCSAALLWIFWGVSPGLLESGTATRAEVARLQVLTDKLVASELAVGLAGGDYGEVQETLNRHEIVGFLASGVVVNSVGKSVATVGVVPDLSVGDPLPPQMQNAGRSINIVLGPQALGRLVILSAPAAVADATAKAVAGLRAAVLLATVFAVLSAVAVIWLWREAVLRTRASRLRAIAAAEARAKAREVDELARHEQNVTDMGPATLQIMESELRKRVAESRDRRGPVTDGPVTGGPVTDDPETDSNTIPLENTAKTP